MPSGLWDIRDKVEVLTPQEIEAGRQECVRRNLQYIEVMPGQPVMTVVRFVEILTARWNRAAQTAAMIDAMRAGYCSITPKTAPPSSDARH